MKWRSETKGHLKQSIGQHKFYSVKIQAILYKWIMGAMTIILLCFDNSSAVGIKLCMIGTL